MFCSNSLFFLISSCFIWYFVFLGGFFAWCCNPFSTIPYTSASNIASLLFKLNLSFIFSTSLKSFYHEITDFSSIVYNQEQVKNNADNISTICVIPLMSFWNIYSIFFQSLLQIYSILKICYDILRYSMIPFLWRKMSVSLDFQRTFQYFQALHSVVRFSLKLFLHDIYNSSWYINFFHDITV